MLILKFLVFLNGNLESGFLLHQQAFEFTTPFLFLWSETHGESFEGEKKLEVQGMSHRWYIFSSGFFFRVFHCVALLGLKLIEIPPASVSQVLELKAFSPTHDTIVCSLKNVLIVQLVFKGQISGSWFWWHIVVISALGSLRRYSKFQARWGYMLALSKNKIYKILKTWNLNVNINVTGAFSFRKTQCIIKGFSDRCMNLKILLSLFHQFKINSLHNYSLLHIVDK